MTIPWLGRCPFFLVNLVLHVPFGMPVDNDIIKGRDMLWFWKDEPSDLAEAWKPFGGVNMDRQENFCHLHPPASCLLSFCRRWAAKASRYAARQPD